MATDIIRWHEETSAATPPQLQARSLQAPAPHDPSLFDECTHAVLAALAFATSAAVMATSAAAAAAAAAAATADAASSHHIVDEFDLNSPSPPRNHHHDHFDPKQHQQQQQQQSNGLHRLDRFTPSALVLHRSQEVRSLCPTATFLFVSHVLSAARLPAFFSIRFHPLPGHRIGNNAAQGDVGRFLRIAAVDPL